MIKTYNYDVTTESNVEFLKAEQKLLKEQMIVRNLTIDKVKREEERSQTTWIDLNNNAIFMEKNIEIENLKVTLTTY